jgi:peptidoglycan/LPS O-acetylase OafA/YrhL
MATSVEYSRELTGLRGLAAIWIVLFHYQYLFGFSPDFFYLAFSNRAIAKGYLAVDFFFVLSGFVLAMVSGQSLISRNGSAREVLTRTIQFYRKRLARIYPLHVLTLLMMAGLYIANGNQILSNDSIRSLTANIFLIHAWGQSYMPDFNYPSWSISVEWLAYLSFPLALTLNRVLRNYQISLIASALVSGFALVGVSTRYREGSFDLTYDWGWARCLLEFWIGMSIYHLHENYSKLRAINKGWLPSMILLGLLCLLMTPNLPDGWIVLICSLTILSIAVGSPVWRLLLGNPISHFLGEISYSIYMLHIFIGTVSLKLWVGMYGPNQSTIQGFLAFVIVLSILIALSTVSFRYFETPSRKYLQPKKREAKASL